MKKFLLFFAIMLSLSCNDNEHDYYSYAIKNDTGAEITEVVVYSYERNVNARCNERNLSIKRIDISDTSQTITTNYPYISIFYSVNNLTYCFKYPKEDDHFPLKNKTINIITVEER